MHLPLGLDPDGLLTTRVRLDPPKYVDDATRVRALESMIDRLRASRGVIAVAAASELPIVDGTPAGRFVVAGQPPPRATEIPWAFETAVHGDYARAVGIPLLEGRTWTDADRAAGWAVAIVNREAVRRYWSGRSPIGERLTRVDASGHPTGLPLQVIGVIDNTLGADITEAPPPRLYTPLAGRRFQAVAFVVRGSGDAAQVASGVRETLREVDPELAVAEVRPFGEIVDRLLREYSLIMALFIGFAAIGLVVAIAGVYGLTAFSVGQRRHEMGVRMALGATSLDVFRLLAGASVRLIAVGVACGAVVAVLVGLLMRSLLVGVGAVDLPTYTAVLAVLAFGALVATYVPAHRAWSIDPAAVLRRE